MFGNSELSSHLNKEKEERRLIITDAWFKGYYSREVLKLSQSLITKTSSEHNHEPNLQYNATEQAKNSFKPLDAILG